MPSVPIEDTVCRCGHWYGEHERAEHGAGCGAPGCECVGFVVDPGQSTPWAIADRGGDPEKWPEHVKRLEYLRAELRAERISYSEIAELQDLADYIDPGDVELREASGLPEFPEGADRG